MITVFINRLLEAARRRRDRRNTIRALSALSDHHLDDVGISRVDIVRLAHDGVCGSDASPARRVQARRVKHPGQSARTPSAPRRIPPGAPARY